MTASAIALTAQAWVQFGHLFLVNCDFSRTIAVLKIIILTHRYNCCGTLSRYARTLDVTKLTRLLLLQQSWPQHGTIWVSGSPKARTTRCAEQRARGEARQLRPFKREYDVCNVQAASYIIPPPGRIFRHGGVVRWCTARFE